VPASIVWWLGTRWASHATTAWVLGTAAVLHASLACTGFHSNDLHRYLWEGGVQLEGINPYTTAPADPSLAPLRDARFARVAYPELPSLYPPLAQASFALAAALGWDELDYRNAVLLLSFGLTVLGVGWLRATGRPVGRVAYYAWCPAALVSAAGGHVDVLMAAALLGFAWSWETGRLRWAAGWLAAAILAKTAAAVVLPWALWRRPRAVATTALPILALGCLPYALTGGVGGSLLTFARAFRFNGFVHPGLAALLGDAAPLAAALALAAWVAYLTLREDAPADAAALALIGLLLLSPVVHYWYLTWYLVLLPGVRGPVLRAGGLAWAASIAVLAPIYLAIANGDALPPIAPLQVAEFLPPLVAVAVAVRRRRRAAARGTESLEFSLRAA